MDRIMLTSKLHKKVDHIGKYNLIKFLEHTTSGVIYQVEKGGQFYSLKLVYDEDEECNLLKEEEKLKSVDCSYVIRIKEIGPHQLGQVCVMQYLEGPTLQKFILSQKEGYIFQGDALLILKNILIGMMELLQANIVHRDLNPKSIIMVQKDKPQITNFGFSRVVSNEDTMMFSFVGNFYYDAPEILSKLPYDFKADIWSLGCVFFQMIFGKYPFTKGQDKQAMLKNVQNLFTQGVFDVQKALNNRTLSQVQPLRAETIDLISFILQSDPDQRPNYVEILAHPAFQLLGSQEIHQEMVLKYQKEMQQIFPMLESTNGLVEKKLEQEQILKNQIILKQTEEEKKKRMEEEQHLAGIKKWQKVVKNMDMYSGLMHRSKILQRQVNGFKQNDILYFQISLCRYTFLIDTYETLLMIPNIQKILYQPELITFQFFMVKMIIYVAMVFLSKLKEEYLQMYRDKEDNEQLILQLVKILEVDIEKRTDEMKAHLNSLKYLGVLITNSELLLHLNETFTFDQKLEEAGKIPDIMLRPFRAALLMSIQRLYEKGQNLNDDAQYQVKQEGIDLEKIIGIQQQKNQVPKSVSGDFYQSIQNLNLSGQQFNVPESGDTTYYSSAYSAFGKSITNNSLASSQKEIDAKMVDKGEQKIIEKHSKGVGYNYIPPSIVRAMLESRQYVQFALRILICVCSNHIFHQSGRNIKFTPFEIDLKEANINKSQQFSYFFQWLSCLSFQESKNHFNLLLKANFPNLVDFQFSFFQ